MRRKLLIAAVFLAVPVVVFGLIFLDSALAELRAKQSHDYVTILASGAVTATSAGTAAVRMPGMVNGYVFQLDVTAAATEVGDTLDVFVQTMIDGTNYVDVAHFTQVLGNGGAKRYITKLSSSAAQAEFENATALGAAALRNILGDQWRVRYAITDAGAANASFTISVIACPM